MNKFKIATTIFLVIIYTGLILLASSRAKKIELFSVSKNEYINFQANYQVLLLGVTLISLITTYLLNRESLGQYFSFGNISASAKEMKWFGIKENDGWIKTGVSLSIVISLATGVFMFFQLKNANIEWGTLKYGILWVLLFSLTNAFGEEMIYRVGVVSPLKDLLTPTSIYVVSAILFGLPHLYGMPNGLIGATMAGVLGLVLAKSLYETNGFFWAWIIHFIQDVIIIGSLYLLSAIRN